MMSQMEINALNDETRVYDESGKLLGVIGFGDKSPISKNHVEFFIFEGKEFYSVKMAICYCKAKFFNNEIIAEKILRTHYPADAKNLVNKLVISDKSLWKKYKEYIAPHIILCKFMNSITGFRKENLERYMRNTKFAFLAMRDYSDFWGANILQITEPQKWTGRNMMGRTLMDIRHYLLTRL